MPLSRINNNAIANNTIIAADLAAGSVTGDKIATGQITGNLLTANCVSGNNIVSGVSLTGNVSITGNITCANITATSINTGSWSITATNTKLYFKYNSANVGSLDSSGNFIALGNVTAYGTP